MKNQYRAIIVYYTRFGNTRQAAEAIYEGMKEGGMDAECKEIKDVKPEDLAQYDVILVGTPTHYGSIAEEMGKFVETLMEVELKGKKAAAFDTRYTGEKTGGLNELEKYMKKLGMEIILPGLAVLLPAGDAWGPLREGEITKCKKFGKTIAQKISGKKD